MSCLSSKFPRVRQLTGLALLLGVVSGCSHRSSTGNIPVSIDAGPGASCALDGMLLADYPGPKAQLQIAGQAAPWFFCDTVELFHTLLDGEQALAVQAVYVQDMGVAEWTEPRGHWFDARHGFYVLGSRQFGSMGPTLASFQSEQAARAFATTFTGKVLRYEEITADMVDLSGGARRDERM